MRQHIDLRQTHLPNQHRYWVYLVIAGFLGLSVVLGQKIGHGDFTTPSAAIALLLGMGVGLWMGDKSWLIIPLVFSFNVGTLEFGGRSVELPEIGMIAMTGLALVRFAARRQKLKFMEGIAAGLLLYAAWTLVAYLKNPVGLAIAGSSEVGARFYFKIALGFFAYVIVANQKISDWDAKRIIWLWVVGSFFSMGWDTYTIFKNEDITDRIGLVQSTSDSFYTWQQSLVKPTSAIMAWLVSAYPLSQIFGLSRLQLPFLFAISLIGGLFSGKRSGTATLLMFPLITGIYRRQYVQIVGLGLFATLILAALAGGQGTAFRLPKLIQRSVSYLPGDWDADVVTMSTDGGGQDLFRKQMRELAWDKIDKSPWIGSGFGIEVSEYMRMIETYQGDPQMMQLAALAMGSSWHNTWLGIWADLGFPATIFWALFWLQMLWVGWWLIRRIPDRSPLSILVWMIFLYTLRSAATSWIGGHSAYEPFQEWWMFGLLVALRREMLEKRQSPQKVTPIENSRRRSQATRPSQVYSH